MLRDRNASVLEERSARNALSEAEVSELLASVDEVWIARGRRVEKLAAVATKPGALRGPTGNFRAPMLRRGRTLLVGFHAASVVELANLTVTS